MEIVKRLVDGSFQNEGRVRVARVVKQAAEEFEADAAFADVFVAIEFGAAGGFGIIAMPDAHVGKADGRVKLAHGFGVTLFADNVIAAYVSVAGIDAGGDRKVSARAAMSSAMLSKLDPKENSAPAVFSISRVSPLAAM